MPGVWMLFGIQLARFDQFFDFRDGDLAGRGHHRIEIARGLAIDQVAFGIAFPGLDDGQVGACSQRSRT